jgi:hypothetical protein
MDIVDEKIWKIEIQQEMLVQDLIQVHDHHIIIVLIDYVVQFVDLFLNYEYNV